jgi:hypothetical protein
MMTNLYAEVASIHIVAEEEIAGVSWAATNLEQLHEVELLN